MREAVASAPGKVNLVLHSGRPDQTGYHPLFTIFEAVSLREYVYVRTRKSPGVGVRTVGYEIPVDGEPRVSQSLTRELESIPEGNHLAARAAKALMPLVAAKWGSSASGLEMTVHKVIPAAGGMAGGSADAAAALVAVNELWELGLGRPQLEAVGRTLGADVPACLHGNWAVGVGRGDVMETLVPSDDSPRHWWALAFFKRGLSTPAVFREFDAMDLGRDSLMRVEDVAGKADAYAGPEVAELLENDLAQAAIRLRPELSVVGEQALRMGASAWMVSGSGPTVAALCESREVASRIAGAWAAGSVEDDSMLSGGAMTWGAAPGARVELQLPSWAHK